MRVRMQKLKLSVIIILVLEYSDRLRCQLLLAEMQFSELVLNPSRRDKGGTSLAAAMASAVLSRGRFVSLFLPPGSSVAWYSFQTFKWAFVYKSNVYAAKNKKLLPAKIECISDERKERVAQSRKPFSPAWFFDKDAENVKQKSHTRLMNFQTITSSLPTFSRFHYTQR